MRQTSLCINILYLTSAALPSHSCSLSLEAGGWRVLVASMNSLADASVTAEQQLQMSKILPVAAV